MTNYVSLQNITVAELVVKYLELEGISHVFGIPGGYISPFLEILRRHASIKLIITRHEEGAAFMADGYARQTGKLGVIFTTAGPGATNALTGIACAKVDRSPLMLIVGQPSTAIAGWGSWQDSLASGINITEIFSHVCGLSEIAQHPENVPSLFSRALRIAYGTPPQPVHISFPINVSSSKIQKVDFPLTRNYLFPKIDIHSNETKKPIEDILRYITAAKNPMILIGNGCSESLSNPELLSLFENFVTRHQIPVMTTPKAKGLFSESHPLSLGVFGIGGSLHSQIYLEKFPPDILIVLGSSLNEWATARWDERLRPSQMLIQVDNDATHLGRIYPVNLGLVADLKVFIDGLSQADTEQSPMSEFQAQFRPALALFKQETAKFSDNDKRSSKSVPLKPQRLFEELSQFAKDRDLAFFLDIGNSTGFFSHYVQLETSHRLHSAYGFTCMGWSTGASIGAKIAAPDLCCLAIMGDGAFLMNGVEIQTAARYKIGIIYLVIFDNCYGMVDHGEQMVSEFPPPLDDYYSLGSPDLIKFAQGLGAETQWIDKPDQLRNTLVLAIKHAKLNAKPQVIIAKIDPNEQAPFKERYNTIKREKAAGKRESIAS